MTLGTAVKISSTFSSTVTSPTVTIYDPNDDADVTAAAMSDQGSNVWQYIYQSSTSNDDGTYKAVVSGTSGSYTAVSKVSFELEINI
jgi:hypothetical protein